MATLRGPFLIHPDLWGDSWYELWTRAPNHGRQGVFSYGGNLFMLAWDSHYLFYPPDILRSTDQGATWEHLNVSFPDLSGAGNPEQWIWCAYRKGNSSKLIVFSDQGDYAQVVFYEFDMADPGGGLTEIDRDGEGGWTPDTWLTGHGYAYNQSTGESHFLFHPRPTSWPPKMYLDTYLPGTGWSGHSEVHEFTGMTSGSFSAHSVVDGDGVLHMFFHSSGNISGIWYRRRETDGSLGSTVEITGLGSFATGNSNINFPAVIGDSIVIPNSQGKFLVGTPISSPVWTVYAPGVSSPADGAATPDNAYGLPASTGRLWWTELVSGNTYKLMSRTFDGSTFGDIEEIYRTDELWMYYLMAPLYLSSGKYGFSIIIEDPENWDTNYYLEWTGAVPVAALGWATFGRGPAAVKLSAGGGYAR